MFKRISCLLLLICMLANCAPNFVFGLDSLFREDLYLYQKRDPAEMETSASETSTIETSASETSTSETSASETSTSETSASETSTYVENNSSYPLSILSWRGLNYIDELTSKVLTSEVLDKVEDEDIDAPSLPKDKFSILRNKKIKKQFFGNKTVKTYNSFFNEEQNISNTTEALIYKHRCNAICSLIGYVQTCCQDGQVFPIPSQTFYEIAQSLLACCSDKYDITSIIHCTIPNKVLDFFSFDHTSKYNVIKLTEILKGNIKCNFTYAAYIFVNVFYKYYNYKLKFSNSECMSILFPIVHSYFNSNDTINFIKACLTEQEPPYNSQFDKS